MLMNVSRFPLALISVAVTFVVIAPARFVLAEDVSLNQVVEQYSAISEISGGSLSQMHGALSVNQAAGDGNAQNNSRSIAVTQESGVAIAYTYDTQDVDVSQVAFPDNAVSLISDNAFNGTTGLISINQVGGASNRQLNAFAMAMSINGELSDKTLAETRSDAPVNGPGIELPVNTTRAAHIDSTAFVGAGGVVQLNQTSGSGNVTSNRFEMSMGHAY